eukprot:g12851.t1
MRVYVHNQGGGDILQVDWPSSQLDLCSEVSDLIAMVQSSLSAEGEGMSESEGEGEGEVGGVGHAPPVPVSITLLDSTSLSPLSPSARIAYLGALADAMDCIRLTAVIEPVVPEDTSDKRHGEPLPDSVDRGHNATSIEHTPIAYAPNLSLDPSCAIIKGTVCNLLSPTLDAVVACDRGRVLQVVPIQDGPPLPGVCHRGVSVAGGRYLLLTQSFEERVDPADGQLRIPVLSLHTIAVRDRVARWVET